MSLLLDALRKAEQERTLGQPPSPETVAAGPRSVALATPGAQRRYRTIVILLLLITLCATALVIGGPAPQPAPSTETREIRVATKPAPARLPPTVAPAPPTQRPAPVVTPSRPPTVTRLDQLEVPPPVLPTPLPPPRVNAAGEVPAGDLPPDEETEERDTAEALVDTAPPTPAPQVEWVPVATVEGTDPSPASPAAATPGPALARGAPTLASLPMEQRSRFPDLRMDVHAWDEDPKRRFVLINGKRYSEGDPLPEGIDLREIVPEGTIFRFEGQRVLLPRPG